MMPGCFSARSHRSGKGSPGVCCRRCWCWKGGGNGWAGLDLQNLAVKALRWWEKGKKEGGKKKRAMWVRGDRFSLKPNATPAPPPGICKVGRPAAGPRREAGRRFTCKQCHGLALDLWSCCKLRPKHQPGQSSLPPPRAARRSDCSPKATTHTHTHSPIPRATQIHTRLSASGLICHQAEFVTPPHHQCPGSRRHRLAFCVMVKSAVSGANGGARLPHLCLDG